VFAPSNEAFALLPPAELESLLDPANIGELVNVLTYHVKNDRLRAEDLSNGQQLETLQGEDVGVSIIGGRVFIGDGEVTTADVSASNGVVHIIDRVLLPPAPGGGGTRPEANIIDLAVATPSLFVLARLLDSAGLVETLAGSSSSS
jgi:transforming growth factor-beta-induced protein